MSKTGPKIDFDFNTSSERPLSKLSENHKINVIGPTELKLWPFKVTLIEQLTGQNILRCGVSGSEFFDRFAIRSEALLNLRGRKGLACSGWVSVGVVL